MEKPTAVGEGKVIQAMEFKMNQELKRKSEAIQPLFNIHFSLFIHWSGHPVQSEIRFLSFLRNTE